MESKIAIVIPVYNRVEETVKCLDSLRTQTYKEFQVIVCDDGSTDQTSKIISEFYTEVVLLKGDGNLWWSGATNTGIRYAIDSNQFDYILTLNNDLTVKEDYIKTLADAASAHQDCMIGSLAVTDDENPKIFFAGIKKINWATAKFVSDYKYLESYSSQYTGIRDSFMLPGRGTLIPISVFKKIGLFNGVDFPQYGADYDFSLLAKRSGFGVKICLDSIVYCNVKATGKGHSINNPSLYEFISSFFSIRSSNNLLVRYKLAKRNCPRKYFVSYMFFDFVRIVGSHFRQKLLGRVKE